MDSETPSSVWLYDLFGWFQENFRQVTIVVVALAIALLAMFVSKENAKEADIAANAALLELDLGMGASATNAATADEFIAVSEQHSGTAAAKASLLLAGRAYFKDGDYDSAKATFDRYLAEDPNGPFAAGAAFGAAACLEAKDQLKEAQSAYEQVGAQYKADPVASQARFAAARMLQAQGMAEQAALAFDELSKSATSQYWAGQASTRREQIYKENPEFRPAPVTEEPVAAGNS